MGFVLSLCEKKPAGHDAAVFGAAGNDGDQSSLLKQGAGNEDVAFQVASTPTPLLKDINFAAIDDNDDPDDSTETSVDDDKIERMLREEEDESDGKIE